MADTGFHVLIFFDATPGKAAALSGILGGLVAPTRAEPGCKRYEPFADLETPDRFVVVEAWETKEQWHAHLQTPHVAKALAQLEAEGLLTKPFSAEQLRPLTAASHA